MTVTSSARSGMLPVWQRKQPPVSRRRWTRSSGSGTTCRPSSWTLGAKGLPLRHAWRCCSGPRA